MLSSTAVSRRPEQSRPIIIIKNLVKQYRTSEKNAVDGISFEVGQGEFFAFLGPNGAGKTTTISILTTTLSKTRGEVQIAGYDLDKDAKEVRRNIGIIFQNPSLDANLTAEENIRFHVSLYGIYAYRPRFHLMPRAYQEQVLHLASILGLAQDIFKPVRTFSGGMKRKLEIVRSLMHNPKILFLDEPTQGLDAVSRRSLWDYLRTVQRNQNTTIFLTTHYIDEAEAADKVCVVNHGKILFEGTPESMKQLMTRNRFIVVDADDRESLKASLAQFNPEVDEDGSLKIRFEGATPQYILTQVKAPLSRIQISAPSLEEAYIDIVSDKGKDVENRAFSEGGV